MDTLTSRAAALARLGLARRPADGAPSAAAVADTHLTLYEYEASPWCRLVREHLTHLGLPVLVLPCPRETLRAEGAFSARSRYRGEALRWAQGDSDEPAQLQFPLLLDATQDAERPRVVVESKHIVSHLWREYGRGVSRPRMDAWLSGDRLPFLLRFASLAAPSGLRPFGHCGLLRMPSSFDPATMRPLELHQAEQCPESRLVRECLSSLEVPSVYRVRDSLRGGADATPTLVDWNRPDVGAIHGSADALEYLEEAYKIGAPLPLHAPVPTPNLGRGGSFFTGARRAMEIGSTGFLPLQL